METTESPLDVLSRAATMVQDCSPPDYDCARPNKDLPTARWRHERRERNGAGYAKHRNNAPEKPVDAPLDMTTPRGLPPPYSQCVGSRGLKSSARPSVITCARKPPASFSTSNRKEQLSDPVIDEHFRRSLGNDYMNLFAGSEEKPTNGSSVTVTGLSVDDHFAKALGDTWVRLQKSDSDSSSRKDDASPPLASTPSTPASTPSPDKTKPATATSLLQPRRGLLSI